MDLGFRILHDHLEIPPILELRAYAVCVFFQLARVISLGEDVFQENGVWNTDRSEILHGTAQDPIVDVLVALKADLSDLDLGAFFHHERNAHR